jgi:hypothetical protein
MLVLSLGELPRFLTTGVASARVTLLAGKARAREDSMPMDAQIMGYANNEATATAKLGRRIEMYYY